MLHGIEITFQTPLIKTTGLVLVDSNPVELSYIDLLNPSAVDGLFTIRRGCLRIEELLRKKLAQLGMPTEKHKEVNVNSLIPMYTS